MAGKFGPDVCIHIQIAASLLQKHLFGETTRL